MDNQKEENVSNTADNKCQKKEKKKPRIVKDCGQWDEKEHKAFFILYIFNLTFTYLGISEVPGAVWFTDLQGYGWKVKGLFLVTICLIIEYIFDVSMLLLCSHLNAYNIY